MKLWLDDLRSPPDTDWHWVTTVDAARTLMRRWPVTIASLDNDLGEGQEEGRRLVLWMADSGIWPHEVVVHSANVVAGEYMTGMIDRYKPHPIFCGEGHPTQPSLPEDTIASCGCVLEFSTRCPG